MSFVSVSNLSGGKFSLMPFYPNPYGFSHVFFAFNLPNFRLDAI